MGAGTPGRCAVARPWRRAQRNTPRRLSHSPRPESPRRSPRALLSVLFGPLPPAIAKRFVVESSLTATRCFRRRLRRRDPRPPEPGCGGPCGTPQAPRPPHRGTVPTLRRWERRPRAQVELEQRPGVPLEVVEQDPARRVLRPAARRLLPVQTRLLEELPVDPLIAKAAKVSLQAGVYIPWDIVGFLVR